MDELEKEVHSILVSQKVPITVMDFLKDYQTFVGEMFPWKKYGYSNAIQLLEEMYKSVSITRRPDGVYLVSAVSRAETRHIQELVAKQKVTTKVDQQRVRIATSGFRSQYPVHPLQPKHWPNRAPAGGNGRHLAHIDVLPFGQRRRPPRKVGASRLAEITQFVRNILATPKDGLTTEAELISQYQKRHGFVLIPTNLGYFNMMDMVEQMFGSQAVVKVSGQPAKFRLPPPQQTSPNQSNVGDIQFVKEQLLQVFKEHPTGIDVSKVAHQFHLKTQRQLSAYNIGYENATQLLRNLFGSAVSFRGKLVYHTEYSSETPFDLSRPFSNALAFCRAKTSLTDILKQFPDGVSIVRLYEMFQGRDGQFPASPPAIEKFRDVLFKMFGADIIRYTDNCILVRYPQMPNEDDCKADDSSSGSSSRSISSQSSDESFDRREITVETAISDALRDQSSMLLVELLHIVTCRSNVGSVEELLRVVFRHDSPYQLHCKQDRCYITKTDDHSGLSMENGIEDLVLERDVIDKPVLWQKRPSDPDEAIFYWRVRVCFVDSPGEFYLQLCGPDYFLDLEILQQELDDVYGDLMQLGRCNLDVSPNQLTANMAVVVRRNGRWQRALVLSKQRKHSQQDDVDSWWIQVFFVDYGGRLEVQLSDCRLIKRSFLRLPAQVVRARLANVQPVNEPVGRTTELDQEWPAAASVKLTSLIESWTCSTCFCLVTDVLFGQNNNPLSCYIANCYLSPEGGGSSVNDQLVETGQARRSDDRFARDVYVKDFYH